jgi:hypothetical protein
MTAHVEKKITMCVLTVSPLAKARDPECVHFVFKNRM